MTENPAPDVVEALCNLHSRMLAEIKLAWRKHYPRMDLTMSDASIVLGAAIEIERLRVALQARPDAALVRDAVILGPCSHERLAAQCTVGRMGCMDCNYSREMTEEESERFPASLDSMPLPTLRTQPVYSGLSEELERMENGLRGSMWANRDEIIELLGKAAAALRTHDDTLEDATVIPGDVYEFLILQRKIATTR